MIRTPPCVKCRYFDKGRCKLIVHIVPGGTTVSTKVENAREDSYLCGPDGLYFSDKDRKRD
jgi:hypothetical protein